jgi:hypothetical protein
MLLGVDAEQLGDEVAALIRALGKGQYVILCAAIEGCGGKFSIEVERLVKEAHSLPPRMEV